MPQAQKSAGLQKSVLKVMRLHFGFVLSYAVSIVIFDTWNLISHEGVVQRWTLVGILFIINVVAWYLTRINLNQTFYKLLVIGVVIADIVFASVNVYWERGMASRYVALYAVAIAFSTVLKSRKATIASAMLSAAGYIMSTTRYFYEHYGEGFKVELYGMVFFYSAVFFVIAALLSSVLSSKD